MDSKIRTVLVVLLSAGVLVFLVLHFKPKPDSGPAPAANHWQFTVKPSRPFRPFFCEPGDPYTFIASGRIKGLVVDQQYHDLRLVGDYVGERPFQVWNGINDRFTVRFNKPVYVTVDFELSGTWSKSGQIDIYRQDAGNMPRLLYLATDQYDPYVLPVKKGQRVEFLKQNEHFFIGLFQNDQKIKEVLVSKEGKSSYNFTSDYSLKFRSAEVPFLFVVSAFTEPRNLELHIRSSTGTKWYDSKMLRAWVMQAGDEITSQIWVDKGDEIMFAGRRLNNKLDVWTGDVRVPNKSGYLYAASDGYMKVKAKEKCVISEIEIVRKKEWKFELQPNEERRISVYAGDIIYTGARSRYFVNGTITEPGREAHQLRADGSMVIKASVMPVEVYAWVQARRYH